MAVDMNSKLNLRKVAAVALCALALSPAALFAANTTKTAEERGVIKSVDQNARQLVVTTQKSKKDETYQWNAQTRFTELNKPANATMLQPGMAVDATFEPGAATPVLKLVKLSPHKSQKNNSTPAPSAHKP